MLNSKPFTLYATFLAKPGQYQELKKVNQQSFDLTQGAEGLEQALLLEPPAEDKPFVFIAVWESKQAFQAFMKAPKTQAFHNRKNIQALHELALDQATAEFYSLMDIWRSDKAH